MLSVLRALKCLLYRFELIQYCDHRVTALLVCRKVLSPRVLHEP